MRINPEINENRDRIRDELFLECGIGIAGEAETGILSQDGIYNMLERNKEILERIRGNEVN